MSGGQTGVDRAALDVALDRSLPCGGWCPRGRTAEDGALPPLYPLHETPDADPAQRTEWNVRDSDATLALVRGKAHGGTALALECAARLGRPTLCVALSPGAVEREAARVRRWLEEGTFEALNVAGPRESEAPGIYEEARAFLAAVLR